MVPPLAQMSLPRKRVREQGKGGRNRESLRPCAARGRAVNEPSSREPATSRWSSIASRAGVGKFG